MYKIDAFPVILILCLIEIERPPVTGKPGISRTAFTTFRDADSVWPVRIDGRGGQAIIKQLFYLIIKQL